MIMELLEKKKPGTECRAWDGLRISCGLAGAHISEIILPQ